MLEDTADFELVLQELARHGGVDFRSYRPESLARRVSRRMDRIGAASWSDYASLLRNETEYSVLCTEFLVHTTAFFRDASCWTYVATTILPGLIQHRADGHVRAWTAGCSTGQEAYTVAMLLAEMVGPVRLHDALPVRFKTDIRRHSDRRPFTVFATDLSEAALRTAARGTYSHAQAASIPDTIRDRYLVRVAGEYRVTPGLRACVVFGRHDLLRDVPLPSIDLVTCRNVMMYFTPIAQRRVLASFAFALSTRERGALLVGARERPHVWSDRFCTTSGHPGVYLSARIVRSSGSNAAACR